LLTTPFSERTGAISPDGRWLSYVSDESRRDEVYLRPYPEPGGTVAVSTNGGTQSVWSRDGRELFYRAGDSLMAIPIQNHPFQAGRPVPLFPLDRRLYGDDPNVPEYDVFPDGKRFVAVLNDQPTTGEEIRVVLNWIEELRMRVPIK
jgi:serine/threonine-protein kinase